MNDEKPSASRNFRTDPILLSIAGSHVQAVAAPEAAPAPALSGELRDSMWAIVFAGGIGSRFWPLSSPTRPKQLLPLVDDRPLITDTLRRIRSVIPPERVLVMTSRDIAPAIHAAVPEIPVANMLSEPAPMGTAASLAWAVGEVRRRAGPNALIYATHADLAISFLELFHNALIRAAAAANRTDSIVLLGVRPTRADPAFGYISTADDALHGAMGGTAVASHDEMRVERFVEKPSEEGAGALIDSGALWHSGMFVSSLEILEREIRAHAAEVAGLLSLGGGGDIATAAEGLTSISIENGLFARTGSLVVVPVDFGWDDVGTWASLRRARELDDSGNGTVGMCHLLDSSANVVHTENGVTILYGVSNLLVVRLDDITFVTTLDRARDLRPLLDSLPAELQRRSAT